MMRLPRWPLKLSIFLHSLVIFLDHLIEQVNEQALHNQPVSHSDNQPTSPPFASNLDKGTHARGGNGIFGEPMVRSLSIVPHFETLK